MCGSWQIVRGRSIFFYNCCDIKVMTALSVPVLLTGIEKILMKLNA
jgi:hypothetical protein